MRGLVPERSGATPPFALSEALHVDAINQRAAAAVGDQVRRIKLSIMAQGPVIGMMRIDGDSFDVWGDDDGGGQRASHRRAGRAKEGDGTDREDGAASAKEEDGREGALPERDTAVEEELLRPVYRRKVPTMLRAGAARGGSPGVSEGVGLASAKGAKPAVDARDGSGHATEKAGRPRSAAGRLGYRLPGRDRFDEYHEVMIVGWSVDDACRPCWVVQNSYGERANCHCAVSPASCEGGAEGSEEEEEGLVVSEVGAPSAGGAKELGSASWLSAPLQELAHAYATSGLTSKRGCVFVEMVNAELLESGRNTDLENNVIAFVPQVDRGLLAVWRGGLRTGYGVAAGALPPSFARKSDDGVLRGPGMWISLLVLGFILLALRYRQPGQRGTPPS